MDVSLSALHAKGEYLAVVDSPQGRTLIAEVTAKIHAHARAHAHSSNLSSSSSAAAERQDPGVGGKDVAILIEDRILIGVAAFNAFLQADVTGPVLGGAGRVESVFGNTFRALGAKDGVQTGDDTHNTDGLCTALVLAKLRKACLGWLEVDGVMPYPHVPHIELFCLARHLLLLLLGDTTHISSKPIILSSTLRVNPVWLRLRIDTWHYKLLTKPSLGAASSTARGTHWSDVPSLFGALVEGVDALRSLMTAPTDPEKEDAYVCGMGAAPQDSRAEWSSEEKALCLAELVNVSIMLSREDAARKLLADAVAMSGFQYALTGALGKRTRFQEKDISQLVVLAKSRGDGAGPEHEHEQHEKGGGGDARPDALPLNDDTLLEHIEYTKSGDEKLQETVPEALAALEPDKQPQLRPVDQIILLAEATLRDSFSPVDTLTLAEVLPYAVRVLDDKSTNWQIYTQALIVRSRIEVHRSRTVERGVLQLQAVVDQVIVDTTPPNAAAASRPNALKGPEDPEDPLAGIPTISITGPGEAAAAAAPVPVPVPYDKPTSFFPAPKPQQSAPASTRLQYIHAISSSPRWHLESELGFAWVHVGLLVSALDIFKRLRLWAEVALCLSATASIDDEDGRGSSGETKARGILRWRLFTRTGTADPPPASYPEPDDDVDPATDPTTITPSSFMGPFRSPTPPNAPRLLCILGELESEPSHYELAWQVSRGRYARAQKALGEHHIQQKDWESARRAFRFAVGANRLSPELWSRLGDISLRLGQFAEAAAAFGRAVAAAGEVSLSGEDARTWSNLGSALLSLYSGKLAEANSEIKGGVVVTGGDSSNSDDNSKHHGGEKYDDEEREHVGPDEDCYAASLLHKSPDALLAQSLAAYKRGAAIAHSNWRIWDNVLTLAGRTHPPSYGDMINAMWQMVHLRKSEDAVDVNVLRAMLQSVVISKDPPEAPGTLPPRGTHSRAVIDLLENNIAPLITRCADLWELIWRERGWRGDYEGAVDAAEKAWRTEIGGQGGTLGGGDADAQRWLVDVKAWKMLVRRTEDLVSVLENWGARIDGMTEGRWRAKARSAVRSVMSKGKAAWEAGEGWSELERALAGVQPSK